MSRFEKSIKKRALRQNGGEVETHLKVKIIFLVGLIFLIYSSVKLVSADLQKINSVVHDGGAATIKIGGSEIKAIVAATDEEKDKGLSGKSRLEPDEGMLFVYDEPGRPAFWMKGMTFPIDIIWISGSKIVEISPEVPVHTGKTPPPTYTPGVSVDKVIEVSAGWVGQHKVKVGDKIKIK